jgi:hypothetical protein
VISMATEFEIYDDLGLKMAIGALTAATTLSLNAVPVGIGSSPEGSMQECGGYRSYSFPFIESASAYSIEQPGTLSVLPFLFEIAPNLRMNMPLLLSQQSLLLELRAEIQKYFPKTPLSIEESFDENGFFCGLYVGIHAQMPVHEAMRKFDQFDDTYVFPNMERLEGIIIDVVY